MTRKTSGAARAKHYRHRVYLSIDTRNTANKKTKRAFDILESARATMYATKFWSMDDG